MRTRAQRNSIFVVATVLAACGIFGVKASSALPVLPQIANGQVSIGQLGNTMTIANSPGSIINWGGFSIAQSEAVRFNQQSPLSSVLNRVTGGDPSLIHGALQSNGKVFLINQNGILIGPTARIDVNGFVASSLNISDQDFMAGRMKFTAGATAGPVENQGIITTPSGGTVYLIAPDVKNTGTITAPNGDILLAAGREVLLIEGSNPEIAYVVSAPEDKAVNLGTITAEAGRIGMYGGIIRQQGMISADSATRDASGRIFLKSTKETTIDAGSITRANGVKGGLVNIQSTEGTTLVSGTVEAKGIEGGGEARILGAQAGLMSGALVDVSSTTGGGGTVLFGGDYQGKNPDIQNAKAIYLDRDATIKADAIESGNGGRVILWSDESTKVYGNISARGGSTGGDGGFVETSSARHFEIYNAPDTGATSGKGGMWLMDPDEDITIGISVDDKIYTTPPFAFAPSNSGGSYLNITTLQDYLQTTGDAEIRTAFSGAMTTGIIHLVDPLVLTLGTTRTLSMYAGNNILIESNIQASGAPLNLNLHSGYGTSAGDVEVTNGAIINLNNGALNIYAQTGVILGNMTPISITAGSMNITNQLSGDISLASGSSLTTTLPPSADPMYPQGYLSLSNSNQATGGSNYIYGTVTTNGGLFNSMSKSSFGGFSGGSITAGGIAIGAASITFDAGFSTNYNVSNPQLSLSNGFSGSQLILSGTFNGSLVSVMDMSGYGVSVQSGTAINASSYLYMASIGALVLGANSHLYAGNDANFLLGSSITIGSGATVTVPGDYGRISFGSIAQSGTLPISIGSGPGVVIPNLSPATFIAHEIIIGTPAYTITDPVYGTITSPGTGDIYVNTAINRPGGTVLFGTGGSVTGTGAITADKVGIKAAGSVNLLGDNAVNYL